MDKTIIEQIKELNVDKMAELFFGWVETGACNDFGVEHTRKCDSNCLECLKEWLVSKNELNIRQ